MKTMIATIALLMAANFAQAKTSCMVSTEKVKGSNNYDQMIYSSELKPQTMLILSKDKSKVTEYNTDNIKSYEQALALNGEKFLAITENEGNTSIVYGVLVVSKTPEKNLSSITAAAVGAVTPGHSVALITKGLAVTCFSHE
jgi:hypothetical protein